MSDTYNKNPQFMLQAVQLLLQRIDYGRLYAPRVNGSLKKDLSFCAYVTSQFNNNNLNGFDGYLNEMKDLTDSYIANSLDLDKTVAMNMGGYLKQSSVEEFYEKDEDRDITNVDAYLEEIMNDDSAPKVLSQEQELSDETAHRVHIDQPINLAKDIITQIINDLQFLNLLYYDGLRVSAPEEGVSTQADEDLFGALHAFQYFEDAVDALIVLTTDRKYETMNANFFAPSAYFVLDHERQEFH